MKKRVLLITGSPGVGKTTVLLKAVEALKAKGCNVGGMISREVRSGGNRVGFQILDLSTGRSGWLAHVNQKHGPRVGKYGVNLEDLNRIGVAAVVKALEECDVVAVDEVGPMELFSEEFKEAVRAAAESRKLVISVIHWRAGGEFVEVLKAREDAETHLVTCENRESVPQKLAEKVADLLSRPS